MILREVPQGVELLFLEVAITLGITIIETINRARVYFYQQF
jgi:hypothetical protein